MACAQVEKARGGTAGFVVGPSFAIIGANSELELCKLARVGGKTSGLDERAANCVVLRYTLADDPPQQGNRYPGSASVQRAAATRQAAACCRRCCCRHRVVVGRRLVGGCWEDARTSGATTAGPRRLARMLFVSALHAPYHTPVLVVLCGAACGPCGPWATCCRDGIAKPRCGFVLVFARPVRPSKRKPENARTRTWHQLQRRARFLACTSAI